MLPQEIIRKKRDHRPLSEDDIHDFISGITNNTVSDTQIAAFCMAVFLNKLSLEERVALTQAMAQSGTVLDWSQEGLDGPVLDKHSSGGIGDKVSLILAPILAACGGYVPMIAGRGLGHTGGTVDKMEAIPGYKTSPDLGTFKKIVKETGCAIIGQTPEIAPADKRMYAVRDIAGCVETLDLITPSILSKKMAAGLDALVMDIKWGNGAFMSTVDEATDLAMSIGMVANGGGLPTEAVITDMNQVLGHSAGNALEVREAIAFLKGEHQEPRLKAITVMLCTRLLIMGGLENDEKSAESKIIRILDSNDACEKFGQMVKALGGPSDLLENTDKYFEPAPVIKEVPAPHDGVITTMNTRDIGLSLIEMGAGRVQTTDKIDPRVGITDIKPIGTAVSEGEPLLTLHAKDRQSWIDAETALLNAITIDEEAPGSIPSPITAIKKVSDF